MFQNSTKFFVSYTKIASKLQIRFTRNDSCRRLVVRLSHATKLYRVNRPLENHCVMLINEQQRLMLDFRERVHLGTYRETIPKEEN